MANGVCRNFVTMRRDLSRIEDVIVLVSVWRAAVRWRRSSQNKRLSSSVEGCSLAEVS